MALIQRIVIEAVAFKGNIMKNHSTKIREIRGYHKFAEECLGWNGSIESLMEDVELESNQDSFRIALGIMKNSGGRSVLDFGAGNCWASYTLSQLGYETVALDMNASKICGLGTSKEYRDKKGIYFAVVLGDCESIPFTERCFDIAFCHHTLHHVCDLDEAVKEISNTLKPNGLMIAPSEHSRSIFSSDEKFRKKHKAIPYGVNEHAYPVQKYINSFKKAGIINIKVSPSQGWDKVIGVSSPSTLKEISRELIGLLLRIPILKPLIRRTFLTLLSSDIMIYGIKK